jgi:hypothetical protein
MHPGACGLNGTIWSIVICVMSSENKLLRRKRIASIQRPRQIFLTYNLWEETIDGCLNRTGKPPQGRRDGSH